MFVIIAIILAIMMINDWCAENAKIEKAEQVEPLCKVAERCGATSASFDEDYWGQSFYCTQGDFTVSYDGSFRASDGTTCIWVADKSRSEEDKNATVFYNIDAFVNEWVKDTDGRLVPKQLYDRLASIMEENASMMEDREKWNIYWAEIGSEYGSDTKPDYYPWELMERPSQQASGSES